MQSFHHSRGRIFFEVLCAFGMSASLAIGWMQTGASALVAAASIAALYALVHVFDLFRRNPVVAAEPQRIEFEYPQEVEPVAARREFIAPTVAVEPQLVIDNAPEEVQPAEGAEPVEATPTPPKAKSRAKAPRRGGGRRAGAPKDVIVAELPPAEEAKSEAPVEMTDAIEPELIDEPFHAPVSPLFEPEPFVRQQQRTMFGRKAGFGRR
jgi:hypothetical protein